MIIDYPGQELIWKLLGIHPYQKNNPHYAIKIRCKERADNFNARNFILNKIPVDKISGIDYKYDFPYIAIAQKIYVKNVFGEISEVEFINEFIEESKNE